ncbi:beaten path Ib isoform 1-T3 [Cochliomyia hominivorax]
MRSSMNILKQTAVFIVIFAVSADFILALRNVSVTVPLAVKRGDNAILICNYDIENDTLYTVKWYRGRREFYRYTPKENPAWKIFASTNGLNVDITQSNASHVFLRNVSTTTSGRYACEVSVDAPSFHTSIMRGEMDVIELPTQRPIITGVHSRYRLGDIINGNCSSDYSKPAANLTWWINDIQVPPNYLRTYEIQKHVEEQLETSVLEINFIVTLQHFIKGRLKLKCSARIHRIYHGETEKYIEEDRPRILASGRSPETFPYDHNDEFDDENGLYLTHYKNYHSSAQSTIINLNSITRFMYMILPVISSLFFIIFNRNILNPLRLERYLQNEHKIQEQQFTTRFLQNHKTKPLQHKWQPREKQQEEQEHRYCHSNCSNSNNDDDNNNDYNYNNHNNVVGKIKITKSLRKSPCKRYKNEIQNSHSCKCQRLVIITANTNTKTNLYTNEVNINDMRHVLR